MNYSIDLTKGVVTTGIAYDATGKEVRRETTFPLSAIVITALGVISIPSQALKAKTVYEKAKTAQEKYNGKETPFVQDFNDAELRILYRAIINRGRTEETLGFAEMILELNPDFDFESFEKGMGFAGE
jgi:hypothetical protein